MKRLIEFPREDRTTILVEVEESEQEGLEWLLRGDVIERAQQTLEKSFEKVRTAAQFSRINCAACTIRRMKLKFGLV